MSQTIFSAGNAVDGIGATRGDDGTLVLKTGASGSQVNALSFAADGTPTFLKTPASPSSEISASVAANALTISASSLSLAFRSTTLGSGTVTTVSGTPANLVVPSTATLGTVSAVQSRLAVLALNNAGTIELAVVNLSGGNDLTETGLISTTAIAAASNSASTVYSTTVRTSVAYRVIGYVESTQTTAGTWATAPSTIQGMGGTTVAAVVARVTSLNGQAGAIVNTTLYAIGSYVNGRPANATAYAVGSTVAGSSLYSVASGTYWNPAPGWFGVTGGQDASVSLVNTGSWRCVSPASYDSVGAGGLSGLWVRYA